jgi:hypothetical protein
MKCQALLAATGDHNLGLILPFYSLNTGGLLTESALQGLQETDS